MIKDFIKQRILVHLSEEKVQLIRKIFYQFVNLFDIHYKIKGEGNKISYKRAFLRHVTFEIRGDNNLIIIKKNAILNNMWIRMIGSNHRLIIGEDSYLVGSRLCFEDNNCLISLGKGIVYCKESHMAASEEGTSIKIGDGTHIGAMNDIRTTDSHSVIDVNTKKRLNPPGDVIIGKNVFIGERSTILKGVKIGDGSVIGIGSIVTKDIPDYCVAVGIPARIIRKNATWIWEKIKDYET
ncbi:hypothetical protein JCM12298_19200 [Desulfothermus naphthae]